MIQLSVIWDVSPRIVDLGGIEVRWYGLLFAMAFFASYILLSKLFKKEGIKIEVLDKLTIYILVGTIIGARLGHVLFYQPDYYLKNPLEVLMIWEGGLASHGAAIGILLAVWMFVRKTKRNAWWVLDRLVIAVPMAGAFIRGGNLMNSEIYGGPTSLPWGFQFV
ncbi:MAG: prolipoprotein diacylglyceryl transferase, partial [Bacteroidetes bacterium]|nr:prolipoprotein diacylglyceryl transferase [Bacteroidota bacterium]